MNPQESEQKRKERKKKDTCNLKDGKTKIGDFDVIQRCQPKERSQVWDLCE